MASYNPYHKWLGIPPEEQPPNHYRLLAISQFESDLDVIEAAAERQMVFLHTFQSGPRAKLAERLLNEVSAARNCLLKPGDKARYDQQLRRQVPPALTPISTSKDASAGQLGVPPEGLRSKHPQSVTPLPAIRVESEQEGVVKPLWYQGVLPVGMLGLAVLVVVILIIRSVNENSRQTGNQQGASGLPRQDDEREINTDEDKPADEKPVKEKPADERPVTEKPTDEKPVEEKPPKEAQPVSLPPEVTEHLLAFYPFNDSAENAVTAKHNGNAKKVTATADRFDKKNRAYGFHESGARINIGNERELVLGTFTISAWFKWHTNLPGPEYIIIKKGSTSSGKRETETNYQLSVQQGKDPNFGQLQAKIGHGKDGDPDILAAKMNIKRDEWYAVTFTYESVGQMASLYLDGKRVVQKKNVAPPFEKEQLPAFIGPWSGSLDDIRIYKIALSEERVKMLHDYEKKIEPEPPDLAKMNLTGTWKSSLTGNLFGVEDNEATIEVTLDESNNLEKAEGIIQRQGVILTSTSWKLKFKNIKMEYDEKIEGRITGPHTLDVIGPFLRSTGQIRREKTTWERQSTKK